eukprot:scaffold434_cov186-Pinguiococcus_pyrenoidosus.AAC.79
MPPPRLDAWTDTSREQVFAHSQVQQRMVPKYWNQTNVGRSVGSSPAETAAQIRDYDLNPKIHR